MSLRAATTCSEGVMQYCNYGYDKSIYTSYEDCMTRKMQECPPEVTSSGYIQEEPPINWDDILKNIPCDFGDCTGQGRQTPISQTYQPPISKILCNDGFVDTHNDMQQDIWYPCQNHGGIAQERAWYLKEVPKIKEFVRTPLGIAAVGVLAYGIYSIFLKSE